MPAALKCYEADFGESAAVPQVDIPTNWLNAFADACLATGLTETNPTLKQELERHAGDQSSFTYKTQLCVELKKIYQRFMAQGEQELNANKKATIANKIQEGIGTCTAGFYNRIILINQSFSTPNNFKALLTKIRHNIVNKAAIKAIGNRPSDAGNHVHLYNQFFLVGSKHFGVQMIQEFDPHSGNMSDEAIGELLLKEFNAEFDSPLHMLINLRDLIKSLLEEQFYYTGRKNEGCVMADANQWAGYLSKFGIPYNSCFAFKYPYTYGTGQGALIRSSVSPEGKSLAELKAMLNNHNGIIFYNNILFYTDFTTQDKSNLVKILYEFSESDDEDALKIKEQFLNLTVDVKANTISLVSSQKLDEIRTGIGMECMLGTLVDLDWQKINTCLLTHLLQEGYLSPSLNGSEEFMLKLLKEQSTPTDLGGFIPLLTDNYIQETQEFLLFLELFPHLHKENKIQLIQLYLRYLPQNQKYQTLLKLITNLGGKESFATIIQEEFKDFTQQKISSEIDKLPPSIKTFTILRLHSITIDNALLYQAFKEFIKQYPEAALFQMITTSLNNDSKVFPTLMLLDCFEVDQKLEYLEKIHDYSNNLDAHKYKNVFLEHFYDILMNTTPAIQEILFSHANPSNDNLIMDLIYHKHDNVKLINRIINLIPTFNPTSIAAVFTLQNNHNKNNVLLYMCQLTPSLLLSTLNKFTERKDIPKEDLCTMLLQVNSTGQNALHYVAKSDDQEVQLEILKIISTFPSSLQKKALEQWVDALESTRNKDQVSTLLAGLLSCIEEVNREAILLQLLLMNSSKASYLFHENLISLSLPLLDKSIHLENHLKLPQLPQLSPYLALMDHQRPELAVALIKRCFTEGIPLDLINLLLQQMIIKKHSGCALELLAMGAEPSFAPMENGITLLHLAIFNNLYIVAEDMLDGILKPSVIQSIILSMLNTYEDLYKGLLKKALIKYTTTNLNNFCYRATGNFALHLAVINTIPAEIMILLCRSGADLTKPNNSGESPLDLAIEFQQFEVVKLLFEHSSMLFTKEQTRHIKQTVIQSGELYLLKYFFDKMDRDKTAQQKPSLFFSKKPALPVANNSLSWQQFDYMLSHFNTKNTQTQFFKLIDEQVSQLGADEETQTLIKAHTQACCNYLRETKGLSHGFHQSHISKLFLQRILCDNKISKDEIEQEALSYIRGVGVYKARLSSTQGSGYEKHSRIAFAYDLGLFKNRQPVFA